MLVIPKFTPLAQIFSSEHQNQTAIWNFYVKVL